MPTYGQKWTVRLQLTDEARQELEQLRDHSSKAYVRERAATILKVAAGQEPEQVAEAGLLKQRDRDSLYRWLARYVSEGVAGLYVRAGRGRKPAFFPSGGGDGTTRVAGGD
jgi:hypothetical protein